MCASAFVELPVILVGKKASKKNSTSHFIKKAALPTKFPSLRLVFFLSFVVVDVLCGFFLKTFL